MEGNSASLSLEIRDIFGPTLLDKVVFLKCVLSTATNKPNTVPYRHFVLVEDLRLFSLTGTICDRARENVP